MSVLAQLSKHPRARVDGAHAAWTAYAIAEFAGQGHQVVIVPDDEAVATIEEDLQFFLGPTAPIATLYAKAALDFLDSAPDRAGKLDRGVALWHAAVRPIDGCLIVSAAALLRKSITPAELLARGQQLTVGATLDRDAFAAKLTSWGWTKSPVVDEPATFAVRGGVIDLFAPNTAHPVRLELFGDTIESLREFDASTQRTIRSQHHLDLFAIDETVGDDPSRVRAALRDLADAQTFPSKKARALIEDLEAHAPLVHRTPYMPAFHGNHAAPIAHLAASRWWVSDSEAVLATMRDAYTYAETQTARRRAEGMLCFDVAEQLAPPDEYVAALQTGTRVLLPRLAIAGTPWPQPARAEGAAAFAAPSAAPVVLQLDLDRLDTLRQALAQTRQQHDGELAEVLSREITRWHKRGARVVIAADSASRAERLAGVLRHRKHEVAVHLPAEGGRWQTLATPGTIVITRSHTTASFASKADAICVLAAADILGAPPTPTGRAPSKSKRDFFAAVHEFSQLVVGDYVVHQRHGVGRYRGLAVLPVGSPPTPMEALHLEYEGGALYLPVYRLGEVERYIGAAGGAPRLDKLGGATWLATQRKVSLQVQALAEELLQLYAQRAALVGHAFPPPDEQYQEFVAAFPYQETPDQASAIAAIESDMSAPRPMDRLVCGDVGYGKTEVALRAIFRCVASGKQAVLLAPTTVLVEQHARTMNARFADFAINIGKLSRFQSKGEQAAVVRQLAEGKVDVVVGTHRLLSNDIRFANLGLVVIDEEQRFGVAHKERLKKMRANVDVLTLTATPIPRTLHLAMTGLRDLSIIATPPTDRRAVRTIIARNEDELIRDAITRELDRGGQVFFITRTIEGSRPGPLASSKQREANPTTPGPARGAPPERSLEQWATHLQHLVPRARIVVAHGQLSADDLETNMMAFVQGQADILLATTIVESGLDIPNANTMLVARADAFGLAQLYQLRGRIGRSNQRAYCYLLLSQELPTEEAQRRLDALTRFAELGAGFAIASADLEIRGGGELLGAKQSGTIAAVGFDTYVRMLEQAVGSLRGAPVYDPVDPELTADQPGFLPQDYVPDPGMRLDLYKRLASVRNDAELQAAEDELVDRFGPLPSETRLLCDLMGFKALARQIAAQTIEVTRSKVAMALPDDSPLHSKLKALGWVRSQDGRWSQGLPAPGGASAGKALLLRLVPRGTENR